MGKHAEIQRLMVEGKSIAETVSLLGISVSTVRYHRSPSRRETQRRNTRMRSRRLKLKAIDYSGGKYLKCNYNTCRDALEFHHTDSGEKDIGIGVAANYRKVAWEVLVVELDKTVISSINCHKELHASLWQLIEEMIELQAQLRGEYEDQPLRFYEVGNQ